MFQQSRIDGDRGSIPICYTNMLGNVGYPAVVAVQLPCPTTSYIAGAIASKSSKLTAEQLQTV